MANRLYDLGREGFLDGSIDWDTDTIKVVLIDSADYTVNTVTDKFLSDIPLAAREEISAALGSKTVALGVADAADTSFPAAAGDPCEAMAIFKDTGTVGTSRLIAYIDTATNLPVILNGGDVAVAWDNGANKIFKL